MAGIADIEAGKDEVDPGTDGLDEDGVEGAQPNLFLDVAELGEAEGRADGIGEEVEGEQEGHFAPVPAAEIAEAEEQEGDGRIGGGVAQGLGEPGEQHGAAIFHAGAHIHADKMGDDGEGAGHFNLPAR